MYLAILEVQRRGNSPFEDGNACAPLPLNKALQWCTDLEGITLLAVLRFPKPKIYCNHFLEIPVTEGVGCTLSSDKNGYSLQRLVGKV